MRIARTIPAAALIFTSLPAAASDFGSGFLIVMLVIYLVASWPFVLPLFYLRGSDRKLKLYCALVVTAFGFVAVLSYPFNLLAIIDPPTLFNDSNNFASVARGANYWLAQPAAFGLSLWLLPKVKRVLANYPIALR